MPGVHLHAATVDDVMSQRFMKKAGTAVDVMTTGVAALVAGVAAVAMPVGWAVALVIVVGVVFEALRSGFPRTSSLKPFCISTNAAAMLWERPAPTMASATTWARRRT